MRRAAVVAFVALLTLGWNVIPSSAADVTGKYNYVEKGYTGTMTIKAVGKFFTLTFRTKDKSSGQMCEFEALEAGERTNDSQPAVGKSESGAKFKISFKGDTATVVVLDKGDECGMSGYFGGKYVKAKK